MSSLNEAFLQVADWCEKHFERQKRSEVGMVLSSLLRVYGQLATASEDLQGDLRETRIREWSARAERLQFDLADCIQRYDASTFALATRFMFDSLSRLPLINPIGVMTNMVYDAGHGVLDPAPRRTTHIWDSGPSGDDTLGR
jgi:hypothetical protein